ncbi:MAG: SLC13 family permease [Alphaproteobacteria bacterium]|jgi:di/tricarboxylate transporter|nr:SLC13 family permease [Alphaproteobacteria bacterium]MBT4018720.1 SLC13 family permease [Alphaproteobacteria bacterium]MBT5162071.1 SLC13 family permease [Alphaproteobacteria bacterium]MBT5917733.1 SLC13 family permease [Alphaproteobacteria bacterium]MBT6385840.1 SLC13 family permease [Alphaproteobacteria bacterium]
MIFPPLPDAHGLAVLALIVLALVLFTRESIALETSSLAVLVILVAGFELFPYAVGETNIHAVDFFSGFGHEAMVAVCALMIAGQALVRTGALEPVGRSLAALWAISPALSLLLTLVVGGALSAVVNNVPIVVLLLPILSSISLRSGKPASRILMPMGFATLVGGMTTTIGTSTNLLVISIAADMGLRRFGMFDFFVPAAIAGGLGILYLWLLAPRMLPGRERPMGDLSPRIFTGHLLVDEDSLANGKTLSEIFDEVGTAIKISEIRRAGGLTLKPLPDVVLLPGDRISVRDTPARLKELEDVLGTRLYTGETLVDEEHPLLAEDQQIAEIVITQGSLLEGRTLTRSHFVDRFQLMTLALHRAGVELPTLKEGIADVRLRVGDVLLVQGSLDQIATVRNSGELLVLDATVALPHTKKAPLALGIMVGIVAMAALGLMSIAVSAVCGVFLLIATQCLNWRDAARALSTQVILIVVASLAMGTALVKTGGADYLAQLFLAVAGDASPVVLLSGLMLVMAVLTNIVSNNAAAVIGTPIAIGIAQQLSLPPEPFVLAVLFGANMSYATPMAYKTNLLVMNAGGYKFSDFLRVGVPLTFIIWLSLSWLLPVLYGLL